MNKQPLSSPIARAIWALCLITLVGVLTLAKEQAVSAQPAAQSRSAGDDPVSDLAPGDCHPGSGWKWTYGELQPLVAGQAQEALRQTGIEGLVSARNFGETDSCGAFELYSVDFEITLSSQDRLAALSQAEIGQIILPVLAPFRKPNPGNVTVSFGTAKTVNISKPSDMPAAPSPRQPASPNAITKKAYLLVNDPILASGQYLSARMGWFSYAPLTQQIVDFFQRASNGNLQYQVVITTVVSDEWLPLKDGFRYTEDSYYQAWNTKIFHPGEFDYPALLDSPRFDICGKLNRGEIDELWLYGFPGMGLYESTLTGPGYFWFNGYYQSSSCSKLMPIMGWNYERASDLAIHSYGHRSESTMTRAYGSWQENRTLHNWDRFGLDKAQSPNYSYSGCGSLHYPPNGVSDYDYSNPSTVNSNCDDFYNYPNLSDPLTVLQPVTCAAWNCDGAGYYEYWFRHLPKVAGCGNDTLLADWWQYLAAPALANTPYCTCFTLTTNVDPAGTGSVRANPGSNCINGTQYGPGTNVTLTASATSGYEFKNWSGDANGSTSPTVVPMNADKTVTANFAKQMPDLRPYAPVGYAYPVVPLSFQGTYAPNTLYADTITFFDWHFINSGNGPATGSFYVELWIDSQLVLRNPYSNLGATLTGGSDDWAYTVATPGWHTVKLVVDPDNTIAESDETNNTWQQQFYWQPINAWKGEYFKNRDVSGLPWLTRDDFSLDFDWGLSSPVPALPVDNFSVRWTRPLDFTAGSYRFHLRHDDGARLNIDDALKLDVWGTCCVWDTTDVSLAGGSHAIRVEMFDGSGAANVSLWWERLDISGWRGEYYNNETLSGIPILVRDDGQDINFNWGDQSPDPLVKPDGFSVRWTRSLNFQGGSYYIGLGYEDGARLYIDGVLVYENWCDACSLFTSFPETISAGTHSLRLEMHNHTGPAIAFLSFTGPCHGFTMSESPSGSGTVGVSPAPNCGISWYSAGTVVTLTATANSPYQFSNWSGDASGSANPTTVTMNSAKSVTANFISPTTTTLSSSANPSVFGQPVTIAATVSGMTGGGSTPTGTVTFKDGTTTLGSATLMGGVGSFTTSALSIGTHSITAVYSGDSSYAGATSAPLTQTVSRADTTTALAPSPNPSVVGQPIQFTATVSAIAPGACNPAGGTITWKDGATTLGSGPLTGSSATLRIPLAVGSHSVTVVYSGNTDCNGSTSSPVIQTVNKSDSNIVLTSSSNPSVYGQSVTLTAMVSATPPGEGTPSGTVTFKDGSTIIGTGTLNNGQATMVTSSLSVGSHSFTAEYGGDTNFSSSTSSALTQNVATANTTTTVSSSVNPAVYGQSIVFTVVVAPVAPASGTPTGSVTVNDGTTTLGTGTLSGGVASINISSLAVGSHSITAAYGGDNDYNKSTFSALAQTVNKADTTTVVSTSANPSVVGQMITINATVSVQSPGFGVATGTVTFKDGTTTLGTGTLSGGLATFSTDALVLGSHSIKAVYGGASDYAGSTSPALNQVVGKADTTLTLISSSPTSVFGQGVTFAATLTVNTPGAGTPTGTVTFKDDTTTLGTGPLSGGQAVFSRSGLSVGSHSVAATYNADSNFNASTSGTVNQTVGKSSTSTTITSSANPASMGQSITLTAHVTPVSPGGGIPGSGSVDFMEGTTKLGTGKLSGGHATLTLPNLPAGSHSMTAIYGGDGNYNGSTSTAFTQTVKDLSRLFLPFISKP